ncbi:ATP-binding protein [Paenibacillus daejeonensis]|uniref:ATP-binding protein n=1 Tax=Paenibacillus daejeonensis TaxID=135193 RepID=UPI000362A9EC|nr:ATP-binding protein [Paenibacillus daejeonensis]
MWKETLLQVMIALLPVFALQLWYNRPDRYKGTPVFIGIFSCLSMILCILFAYGTDFAIKFDFSLVSYILGALYGGKLIAILMTLVYGLLKFTLADSPWEAAGFAMGFAFIVPFLFVYMHRFKLASRRKKQRLVVLLGLGSIGAYLVGALIYLLWSATAVHTMIFLESLATIVALVGISIIFIFLIESVKDKQQLQYRLQQMSTNYRNEVQKLQQFIDNTPLGVVIVDKDGDITHINEMAMSQMPEDSAKNGTADMIGRSLDGLQEEMNNDLHASMLMSVLNGNDSVSEIVQQDNKMYIKTGFSVKDARNHEIIGAALIAHDITEVSQLRDEVGRMERLSLVGQMAASITHEIRNPMAVIRGFVQLMKERSPENQREYFRIIIEELDRANGIINDFLSLAQNRIVEKESSSLNHIIGELMPLLWADANLRGQTIELGLDEAVPDLDLNVKEMKQLILNLARNGMEAMDEKGRMKINTRFLGDVVEMRVEDTGCGISKDKQERLFEPFYTTKSRGTGLGLPLCLSIVERHHGKIEVQSKEGEGTTFRVVLRCQPNKRIESGSSAHPSIKGGVS